MPGFDLHIHSLYSDGELLPAEIAQRYSVLGYETIAITDHADNSNLEFILSNLAKACPELSDKAGIEVLPGIELTHVPPEMLGKLVKKSRRLGAKVIVVHGETLVEPVRRGTNAAAVKLKEVDVLAHPGFITREEAESARDNGIFLELSARRGHSLANGHVAKMALEVGAKLLVNTDSHSPGDLVPPDFLAKIARASGISEKVSKIITTVNPKSLLRDL